MKIPLILFFILSVSSISDANAMWEDEKFSSSEPSKIIKQREITKGKVKTKDGDLFYRDTGREGPVLALFHGNSASSKIFEKLMKANLPYRMIAFDSPGHGKSDDFLNYDKVYSHLGTAQVFLEGLENLGVKQFSVLGWSKGGHEAINMLSLAEERMESLIITGTPPLPNNVNEIFSKAFKAIPEMSLLGKEEPFNEEEARRFVSSHGLDPETVPFMVKAALRTNGLARARPFQIIKNGGERINEISTLQNSKIPILVLGGKADNGVNYDYVSDLMKDFPSNIKMNLLEGPHGHLWTDSRPFIFRVQQFLQKSYTENFKN